MTLDALIRSADPAPAARIPGSDSFEGRAILRRVTAEKSARRRAPFVLGGAAAGAGALAVGITLAVVAGDVVPGSVPTVPGTTPISSGSTPTAPVATFAHLVDVALGQPATAAPGPGQYEYTRSQEAYANCNAGAVSYCYLLPEERQIWVGTDGSGRLLESFGTPMFETPAARAAWLRDGSPPLGLPTSDTTFGAGGLSLGPSDLSGLPTNPTALAADLSTRKIEGGPPGPAEDFVQIGDMLRETDASPALRAAIFEVAEGIPGVVVLGTVSDHSGRPGIGVGRVGDDGVEQEYVFDSTTSAFLGEETVATRPDASTGEAPAGTVLGWAVYESQGIVSSLSLTPTGAAPPAPPVSCATVSGTPSGAPTAAPSESSALPAGVAVECQP